MNKQFSPWLRGSALLLILMFTWTNVVLPAPTAESASIMAQVFNAGYDARLLGENPFGLKIHEESGSIAGFYDGGLDGPLVVQLQDAHGNISAQENLRQIISDIAHKQIPGSVYILMEGASGFVSAAPLRSFLNLGFDPTGVLLQKGVINGPELAALENPDLTLWGIESPEHYRQNLEAWLRAKSNESRNLEFITHLHSRTRDLLWSRASEPLRKLITAEDELRQEQADLQNVSRLLKPFIRIYRRELTSADRNKPVSTVQLKENYPNVYRFMQSEYLWKDAREEFETLQQKKENRPEMKAHQARRSEPRVRAAEAPKKAVPAVVPDAIQSKPAETGRENNPAPLLELLPDFEEPRETMAEGMMNFVKDLYQAEARRNTTSSVEKYLRTTEDIDSFLLFRELHQFISNLKENFNADPQLSALDRLDEKLALLRNLASLTLTHQDYMRLKELGLYSREHLINEYERFSGRPYDGRQDFWQPAANTDYYELALMRDQELFYHVRDFWQVHSEASVLFVFTGGFHTPGLSHRMRGENISYVTVQPSIERIEKSDPLRYRSALEWGRSALAIRTALSTSPAALVHEAAIPFIARKIIEAGDGEDPRRIFEETRTALIQAYDTELRDHISPQLVKVMRLDNPDTAEVTNEIERRRRSFQSALAELDPVFEDIIEARLTGLVNTRNREPIRVELENEILVIRPYSGANPVTRTYREPKGLRVLEHDDSRIQAMLHEDGYVYIRDGLSSDQRERAVNHDVRAHIAAESARREKTLAYRAWLEQLNQSDAAARRRLKELFYEIRILKGPLLNSLSPDEITERINFDSSVMPERPELWQEAVQDSENGPVFSAHFLDEAAALFFGMLAQYDDSDFAAIKTPADYRLRDSALNETGAREYFEIFRDIAADPEVLRSLGYFDFLEQLLSRNVTGAEIKCWCYAFNRKSIYSESGIKPWLLNKLWGTSDDLHAEGDEETEGILRYNGQRFIDQLLKSVGRRWKKAGYDPRGHEMTEVIESVALHFFENTDNPENWTEDQFIEMILRGIAEFGVLDYEELKALIESDPSLKEWLRKLFAKLRDLRREYDRENPEWRKAVLKKIQEKEGGGGHHQKPAPPAEKQPGQIPAPPSKEEPNRRKMTNQLPGEIMGHADLEGDHAHDGLPPHKHPHSDSAHMGLVNVSRWMPPERSETRTRDLLSNAQSGLVGMSLQAAQAFRSELRDQGDAASEPSARYRQLRNYAVERLAEFYPDLSETDGTADGVFEYWFGRHGEASKAAYEAHFNLLQKPGAGGGSGSFYHGENMTAEDIELMLTFMRFMNPDAPFYPESPGRSGFDGSPMEQAVKGLLQDHKRVWVEIGDAGVGKSRFNRSFVKHITSPEFTGDSGVAPEERLNDPKWLVFEFDTLAFLDQVAELKKITGQTDEQVQSMLLGMIRTFLNRPNVILIIDEAHEVGKIKTGMNSFFEDLKRELSSKSNYMRMVWSTTKFEYDRDIRQGEDDPLQRRTAVFEFPELDRLYIEPALNQRVDELDTPVSELSEDERVFINELQRLGIRFQREDAGESSIVNLLIALKNKFAPEWASPAKELAWLESLSGKIQAFLQDYRTRSRREAEDLTKMLNHYIRERRLESSDNVSANQQRAFRKTGDQDVLIERVLEMVRFLRMGEELLDTRTISAEHLYASVSEDEDIPVQVLSFQGAESEEELLEKIEGYIVGQDEAAAIIVSAYQRYRQRKESDPQFKEPFKVLFVGPSTVGKTYMGKVLATVILGNPDAIEIVSMTDFGASHTVAKMSGSPPGYVDSDKPGLWTRLFRQHKSVFVALLDEIEKSHPAIFDYLMPAMREGVLEDMQGNKTVWNNIIMAATSNLGMTDPESDRDKSNRARIEKLFEVLAGGDADELTYQVNRALSEIVDEAVRDFLRAEFMNRFTVPEPVYFKWLHPDSVRELIDRVWIPQLVKDLENRGVRVDFDLTKSSRVKIHPAKQYLFDELVAAATDMQTGSDGTVYFLEGSAGRLTAAGKNIVQLDLGFRDIKEMHLIERGGSVKVILRHAEGISEVDPVTGQTESLLEGTDISFFAVNSKHQAVFIRSGKVFYGSLGSLAEADSVKVPGGFTAAEAVRSGQTLYITDGFDILAAAAEDASVVAQSMLERPEETRIRNLQVDSEGRLFYLTDQQTEHVRIEDKEKQDQLKKEVTTRLQETRYSLLSGDQDVITVTVKDADGVEQKRLYRRESVYSHDDGGNILTDEKETPIRSKSFEQYLRLNRELTGLQGQLAAMADIRQPNAEQKKAWEELSRRIEQLESRMQGQFQMRSIVGFGRPLEEGRFYVRADEAFEKQYWEWDKEREAVEKKFDHGISGEKETVTSTFIVYRDRDGREVQRKDLAFGKSAVYQDEKARRVREKAEALYGSLPDQYRLSLDEEGGLYITDAGKRTVSRLENFEYSELADHLVETHYDNVFEGISRVQKAFEEFVSTPVERKDLDYGEQVTVRFNRYRSDSGESRGSLRFEEVTRFEDVQPTSLMPRVGSKAQDDVEQNVIRRLDQVLDRVYRDPNQRQLTSGEVMQVMEETIELDVEKTISLLQEKDPYWERREPFDSSTLLFGGEDSDAAEDDPEDFHAVIHALELPNGAEAHQVYQHGMDGLYQAAADLTRTAVMRDMGIEKPFAQLEGAERTQVNRKFSSDPAYEIQQRWGLLQSAAGSRRNQKAYIGAEVRFGGYLAPEDRIKLHQLLHLDLDDAAEWDRYDKDPAFANKSLIKAIYHARRIGARLDFLTEKVQPEGDAPVQYVHRLQLLIPAGVKLPDEEELKQKVASQPAVEFKDEKIVVEQKQKLSAVQQKEVGDKIEKFNSSRANVQQWLQNQLRVEGEDFDKVWNLLQRIAYRNYYPREDEEPLPPARANEIWAKHLMIAGLQEDQTVPLINQLRSMDLLPPLYNDDDLVLPVEYYFGASGYMIGEIARYYQNAFGWTERRAHEHIRDQFYIGADDGTELETLPADFAQMSAFMTLMNNRTDEHSFALNREREQTQLRAALNKREQRTVMMTAAAGAGKSYTVNSHVKREVEIYKTPVLYFELDVRDLKNRMGSGSNVAAVVKTIRRFADHPNIVVFVDEAHELNDIKTGIGTFLDMLKPQMAMIEPESYIRFIFGTTEKEAEKYFQGPEGKANLRRMHHLRLPELSYLDIKMILRDELLKIKKKWGRDLPGIDLVIDEGLDILIADFKERVYSDASSPDREIALADALKAYVAEKFANNQSYVIKQPEEVANALNLMLDKNRSLAAGGTPSGDQRSYNLVNKPVLVKMLRHLHKRAAFAKEHFAPAAEPQAGAQKPKAVLGEAELLEMLSTVDGFPMATLNFDSERALEDLRVVLKQEIIGQDEAIDKLVDWLRIYFNKRKKADFVLPFFVIAAGLSTVGKTETAKVLARHLFGSEDRYALISFTDYGLEHTVSRLIGSPPGYIGSDRPGLLYQQWRENLRGGGVALLDEMEKGHPSIFNPFLQAFREGINEDMQGNKMKWAGLLAWGTTNLGVSDLDPEKSDASRAAVKDLYEKLTAEDADEDVLFFAINNFVIGLVDEAVKSYFRPEMLNRQFTPGFLYYNWIHPADARRVVDQKFLRDYINSQRENGVRINLRQNEEDMNFNLRYGRSLRFQDQVKNLSVDDIAYGNHDEIFIMDAAQKKIFRLQNESEIASSFDLDLKNPREFYLIERYGTRRFLVVGEAALLLLDENGSLIMRIPKNGIIASSFDGENLYVATRNDVTVYKPEHFSGDKGAAKPAVYQVLKGQDAAKGFSVHNGRIAVTDGSSIYTVDSATGGSFTKVLTDENGIQDIAYDESGRLMYLSRRSGLTRFEVSSNSEAGEALKKKKEDHAKETGDKYRDVREIAGDEGRVFFFTPVTSAEAETYRANRIRFEEMQQRIKTFMAPLEEILAPLKTQIEDELRQDSAFPNEIDKAREYTRRVNALVLKEMQKQSPENYAEFVSMETEYRELDDYLKRHPVFQRPSSADKEGDKSRTRIGFITDTESRYPYRLLEGRELEAYRQFRDKERGFVSEVQNQSGGLVRVETVTADNAAVLVYVDSAGRELEVKDLYYRERPKTGDEEQRRLWEKTRSEETDPEFAFSRGADGSVLLRETRYGTVNQIEGTSYSKFADYLVDAFYTDVFQGVSNLRQGFQKEFVQIIESNPEEFGELNAGAEIEVYFDAADHTIKAAVKRQNPATHVSLQGTVKTSDLSEQEADLISKIDDLLDEKLTQGGRVTADEVRAVLEQVLEIAPGDYQRRLVSIRRAREITEEEDIVYEEEEADLEDVDMTPFSFDQAPDDDTLDNFDVILDEQINEDLDPDEEQVPVRQLKNLFRAGAKAMHAQGRLSLQDAVSIEQTRKDYRKLPDTSERKQGILRDARRRAEKSKADIDAWIRANQNEHRFQMRVGIFYNQQKGSRLVGEFSFHAQMTNRQKRELNDLLSLPLEDIRRMKEAGQDKWTAEILDFLELYLTFWENYHGSPSDPLRDRRPIYRNPDGDPSSHRVLFEIPIPGVKGSLKERFSKARLRATERGDAWGKMTHEEQLDYVRRKRAERKAETPETAIQDVTPPPSDGSEESSVEPLPSADVPPAVVEDDAGMDLFNEDSMSPAPMSENQVAENIEKLFLQMFGAGSRSIVEAHLQTRYKEIKRTPSSPPSLDTVESGDTTEYYVYHTSYTETSFENYHLDPGGLAFSGNGWMWVANTNAQGPDNLRSIEVYRLTERSGGKWYEPYFHLNSDVIRSLIPYSVQVFDDEKTGQPVALAVAGEGGVGIFRIRSINPENKENPLELERMDTERIHKGFDIDNVGAKRIVVAHEDAGFIGVYDLRGNLKHKKDNLGYAQKLVSVPVNANDPNNRDWIIYFTKFTDPAIYKVTYNQDSGFGDLSILATAPGKIMGIDADQSGNLIVAMPYSRTPYSKYDPDGNQIPLGVTYGNDRSSPYTYFFEVTDITISPDGYIYASDRGPTSYGDIEPAVGSSKVIVHKPATESVYLESEVKFGRGGSPQEAPKARPRNQDRMLEVIRKVLGADSGADDRTSSDSRGSGTAAKPAAKSKTADQVKKKSRLKDLLVKRMEEEFGENFENIRKAVTEAKNQYRSTLEALKKLLERKAKNEKYTEEELKELEKLYERLEKIRRELQQEALAIENELRAFKKQAAAEMTAMRSQQAAERAMHEIETVHQKFLTEVSREVLLHGDGLESWGYDPPGTLDALTRALENADFGDWTDGGSEDEIPNVPQDGGGPDTPQTNPGQLTDDTAVRLDLTYDEILDGLLESGAFAQLSSINNRTLVLKANLTDANRLSDQGSYLRFLFINDAFERSKRFNFEVSIREEAKLGVKSIHGLGDFHEFNGENIAKGSKQVIKQAAFKDDVVWVLIDNMEEEDLRLFDQADNVFTFPAKSEQDSPQIYGVTFVTVDMANADPEKYSMFKRGPPEAPKTPEPDSDAASIVADLDNQWNVTRASDMYEYLLYRSEKGVSVREAQMVSTSPENQSFQRGNLELYFYTPGEGQMLMHFYFGEPGNAYIAKLYIQENRDKLRLMIDTAQDGMPKTSVFKGTFTLSSVLESISGSLSTTEPMRLEVKLKDLPPESVLALQQLGFSLSNIALTNGGSDKTGEKLSLTVAGVNAPEKESPESVPVVSEKQDVTSMRDLHQYLLDRSVNGDSSLEPQPINISPEITSFERGEWEFYLYDSDEREMRMSFHFGTPTDPYVVHITIKEGKDQLKLEIESTAEDMFDLPILSETLSLSSVLESIQASTSMTEPMKIEFKLKNLPARSLATLRQLEFGLSNIKLTNAGLDETGEELTLTIAGFNAPEEGEAPAVVTVPFAALDAGQKWNVIRAAALDSIDVVPVDPLKIFAMITQESTVVKQRMDLFPPADYGYVMGGDAGRDKLVIDFDSNDTQFTRSTRPVSLSRVKSIWRGRMEENGVDQNVLMLQIEEPGEADIYLRFPSYGPDRIVNRNTQSPITWEAFTANVRDLEEITDKYLGAANGLPAAAPITDNEGLDITESFYLTASPDGEQADVEKLRAIFGEDFDIVQSATSVYKVSTKGGEPSAAFDVIALVSRLEGTLDSENTFLLKKDDIADASLKLYINVADSQTTEEIYLGDAGDLINLRVVYPDFEGGRKTRVSVTVSGIFFTTLEAFERDVRQAFGPLLEQDGYSLTVGPDQQSVVIESPKTTFLIRSKYVFLDQLNLEGGLTLDDLLFRVKDTVPESEENGVLDFLKTADAVLRSAFPFVSVNSGNKTVEYSAELEDEPSIQIDIREGYINFRFFDPQGGMFEDRDVWNLLGVNQIKHIVYEEQRLAFYASDSQVYRDRLNDGNYIREGDGYLIHDGEAPSDRRFAAFFPAEDYPGETVEVPQTPDSGGGMNWMDGLADFFGDARPEYEGEKAKKETDQPNRSELRAAGDAVQQQNPAEILAALGASDYRTFEKPGFLSTEYVVFVEDKRKVLSRIIRIGFRGEGYDFDIELIQTVAPDSEEIVSEAYRFPQGGTVGEVVLNRERGRLIHKLQPEMREGGQPGFHFYVYDRFRGLFEDLPAAGRLYSRSDEPGAYYRFTFVDSSGKEIEAPQIPIGDPSDLFKLDGEFRLLPPLAKWDAVRQILLKEFGFEETRDAQNGNLRLHGISPKYDLDLLIVNAGFTGNAQSQYLLSVSGIPQTIDVLASKGLFRGYLSNGEFVLALLTDDNSVLIIPRKGIPEVILLGDRSPSGTRWTDFVEMHGLQPVQLVDGTRWMTRAEYLAYERWRENQAKKRIALGDTKEPFKFENGLAEYEAILGFEEGQLTDFLYDEIDVKGPVTVFDVGAGKGKAVADLGKIDGVKPFGQTLVRFDDPADGLDIREGDAVTLLADSRSVDVAFSIFNMFHTGDPYGVLEEIFRTLKIGGTAFVTFDRPNHYREVTGSQGEEEPLNLADEFSRAAGRYDEQPYYSQVGSKVTIENDLFKAEIYPPGDRYQNLWKSDVKSRHPVLRLERKAEGELRFDLKLLGVRKGSEDYGLDVLYSRSAQTAPATGPVPLNRGGLAPDDFSDLPAESKWQVILEILKQHFGFQKSSLYETVYVKGLSASVLNLRYDSLGSPSMHFEMDDIPSDRITWERDYELNGIQGLYFNTDEEGRNQLFLIYPAKIAYISTPGFTSSYLGNLEELLEEYPDIRKVSVDENLDFMIAESKAADPVSPLPDAGPESVTDSGFDSLQKFFDHHHALYPSDDSMIDDVFNDSWDFRSVFDRHVEVGFSTGGVTRPQVRYLAFSVSEEEGDNEELFGWLFEAKNGRMQFALSGFAGSLETEAVPVEKYRISYEATDSKRLLTLRLLVSESDRLLLKGSSQQHLDYTAPNGSRIRVILESADTKEAASQPAPSEAGLSGIARLPAGTIVTFDTGGISADAVVVHDDGNEVDVLDLAAVWSNNATADAEIYESRVSRENLKVKPLGPTGFRLRYNQRIRIKLSSHAASRIAEMTAEKSNTEADDLIEQIDLDKWYSGTFFAAEMGSNFFFLDEPLFNVDGQGPRVRIIGIPYGEDSVIEVVANPPRNLEEAEYTASHAGFLQYIQDAYLSGDDSTIRFTISELSELLINFESIESDGPLSDEVIAQIVRGMNEENAVVRYAQRTNSEEILEQRIVKAIADVQAGRSELRLFNADETRIALNELAFARDRGFVQSTYIEPTHEIFRALDQAAAGLSDADRQVLQNFSGDLEIVRNPVKKPDDNLFIHLDAEDLLYEFSAERPLRLGELTFNLDGRQAFALKREAGIRFGLTVRESLFNTIYDAVKAGDPRGAQALVELILTAGRGRAQTSDSELNKKTAAIRESLAYNNREFTAFDLKPLKQPRYLLLSADVIRRNFGIARSFGALASLGYKIFIHMGTDPLSETQTDDFFETYHLNGFRDAGIALPVYGRHDEVQRHLNQAARKRLTAEDVITVSFAGDGLQQSDFQQLTLEEDLLGVTPLKRADYPVPLLAAKLLANPEEVEKLGDDYVVRRNVRSWHMVATPSTLDMSEDLARDIQNYQALAQLIASAA